MDLSQLQYLKPILTTLIVPPAGLLLLVFAGLLLALKKKPIFKKLSSTFIFTGALLLWILSCQDTAVWLSQNLLIQYPPTSPSELKDSQVILVLGGGAESFAPEYAGPALSGASFERLRYAVYLSKTSRLPIAFSGGKGWADPTSISSEAEIARLTLQRDWNLQLKFAESNSRDTRENANLSYPIFSSQGITKIVLVTHATHMPRALRNFREAGFKVIPAPMGFVSHSASPLLDALPSEGGLQNSRSVIKEWLGMLVT